MFWHCTSIAQQPMPIYNTTVHKNNINVPLMWLNCWCYETLTCHKGYVKNMVGKKNCQHLYQVLIYTRYDCKHYAYRRLSIMKFLLIFNSTECTSQLLNCLVITILWYTFFLNYHIKFKNLFCINFAFCFVFLNLPHLNN